MLLDQKLEPDQPLENQCGSCQKCVEACPAQIIGKPEFAANQCLSYLTQSKELLTEEQVSRLNKQIFGCDACQEVCPHNQEWLRGEAAAQPQLSRGVDLWEILHLTKSEFNERYKGTAAGWRGKGILQRNAYLALQKNTDLRLEKWKEDLGEDGIPLIIQPYI
jgi:epoxyqueuosine reductase